jgi:hypothetical protein
MFLYEQLHLLCPGWVAVFKGTPRPFFVTVMTYIVNNEWEKPLRNIN